MFRKVLEKESALIFGGPGSGKTLFIEGLYQNDLPSDRKVMLFTEYRLSDRHIPKHFKDGYRFFSNSIEKLKSVLDDSDLKDTTILVDIPSTTIKNYGVLFYIKRFLVNPNKSGNNIIVTCQSKQEYMGMKFDRYVRCYVKSPGKFVVEEDVM